MSATTAISATTPKPTSTTSAAAAPTTSNIASAPREQLLGFPRRLQLRPLSPIILSMEGRAQVLDSVMTKVRELETLNKTLGTLQAPSKEQLRAQTEAYSAKINTNSLWSILSTSSELRHAITIIQLPLSDRRLMQFQYFGKVSDFNNWIAESKGDVCDMTQTADKIGALITQYEAQYRQAAKTLGQLCYDQLTADEQSRFKELLSIDKNRIKVFNKCYDTRSTTNNLTPTPTSTASQAPALSKTQASTTPTATPATAPSSRPQPTTTTVTPVIAATTASSTSAATQPPANTATTTSQVSTSTATTSKTDAFPTKTQGKRVTNAPFTASTSNSERPAKGISIHSEAIQEFIRKMNSHSIQPNALSEALEFYNTTFRAIQEMTGQLNELGGAIAKATLRNTKT